jgi:hypothetical protein
MSRRDNGDDNKVIEPFCLRLDLIALFDRPSNRVIIDIPTVVPDHARRLRIHSTRFGYEHKYVSAVACALRRSRDRQHAGG